MEDAATAEICRTQIWQWLYHGASLDDGTAVNSELLQQLLTEELNALCAENPHFEDGRFDDAASLFSDLCTSTSFTEFLTLPAYERLA
jgi:malate synthase